MPFRLHLLSFSARYGPEPSARNRRIHRKTSTGTDRASRQMLHGTGGCMNKLLQQACSQGDIQPLDLEIGLFLEKQSGGRNPELLLAAALASAAVGSGHVCLPLEQAGSLLVQKNPDRLPDPGSWRKILFATSAVGRPGETAPLILDQKSRLYLYRFFQAEQRVAKNLKTRAMAVTTVNTNKGRQLLAQLFPQQNEERINDQHIAAALALLKPLLIISGGPGTGKTWTVARILALMQAMSETPLRVGLATPTGKAAARLQESIRSAEKNMDLQTTTTTRLPQAQTLHRLLGYRPMADDFSYNADNPLHLDLLIVDEASMIDLTLMDVLLAALPSSCRLILLGDRHQLASVEAGSLFSDLCADSENCWSPELCQQVEKLTGQTPAGKSIQVSRISDSVITLQTGFRFHEKSGIGTLAAAVNSGRLEEVETCLSMEFSDLQVQYLSGSDREQWLKEQILKGYRAMVGARSVEQAFAAMEGFRLLCAVRKGTAGVEGINNLAEQVLNQAGLIAGDTDFYQGKPIIIRRNQYQMQLFNGDTGILWNDEKGSLKAWFMQPDNHLHPITPARLPEHDAAWAITIHKAQGSEFNQVLLLLPEKDSRVLSRELLYTGITRAKNHLILCCDPALLSTAVCRKTRRYSGLADQLQQ
ncbi:MAG TPA: exodeoxyribonuclease V subunit alpha [Desulfobulbaceae bacterium]|nr:exodeoxyribonuclease V subunit alpha [Desulfobulbaceae bacterium]